MKRTLTIYDYWETQGKLQNWVSLRCQGKDERHGWVQYRIAMYRDTMGYGVTLNDRTVCTPRAADETEEEETVEPQARVASTDRPLFVDAEVK